MINKLIQNWPISSAGLLMILSNVIHLAFMFKAGTADETTVERAATGILGGLGLIFTGHRLATNSQNSIENSAAIVSGDSSAVKARMDKTAPVPAPTKP
jgi:hypothetical protein